MEKKTPLRSARKLLLGFGILFAAALGVAEGQTLSSSRPRIIIDTHAHIMRGSPKEHADVSEVLRAMDQFGVAKTILLSPPFPPNRTDTYGREELEPIARKNPQRFAFVAGGESLNSMILSVAPEDVAPDDLRRLREEAVLIADSGAVGFGEIAAEHFSSGRGRHPYESARPDHPLLLALSDIAAQHGMPIDLHMEAVPRDMKMPERMRKGENPDQLKENISGLERLLAHNRKTRIIWAHAGWDLTGERNAGLMHTLLEKHPNLYMSIKLDARRGRRRSSPFTQEGTLRPVWVSLLRAFPNRFMIGSDQFFSDGTERLAMARKFVDALPEDLAHPIASENAKRVYQLEAKSR